MALGYENITIDVQIFHFEKYINILFSFMFKGVIFEFTKSQNKFNMQESKLKSIYDEQGYIAIESFLDANELSELIANTNRFTTTVVPTIVESEVYYEDKTDLETLKQVQHLDEFDVYYRKLAESEKMSKLASLLLGGNAILKNMQYFNKIPKIGKETPAHQDGYYFKIKPQEALTMWLSLGVADAENGAVCYIPRSHKWGMRNHGRTSLLGFSQSITDWSEKDDKAEIQMIAKPGDILVHHSLTIHRANANKSNRTRESIGFIFYRDDVKIDNEAHAEYKKQLDSELKKQGKI